jgi:hypothetical protein
MPEGLKGYYGTGELHYITCSCYQRKGWLGTDPRRDLFLEILEKVRKAESLFHEWLSAWKARPSGAKARILSDLNGTAEAVPFPKPIYDNTLHQLLCVPHIPVVVAFLSERT